MRKKGRKRENGRKKEKKWNRAWWEYLKEGENSEQEKDPELGLKVKLVNMRNRKVYKELL